MQDLIDSNDLPTVLLVDDDQFTHDVMQEALQGECCLVSVGDGEDALMVCQQWYPDLIIIDVEMPGIDGYETCRRLRNIESLQEAPIMFLSGHDQPDDRLKGYEAGGDDYVSKPFNLMSMKSKVLSLLNIISQRKELKSRVAFATKTAMTAMSNMSELGALLETLKQFNACLDPLDLAKNIICGIAVFDLQGVVKITCQDAVVTWTGQGPASPLEISVIEHMSTMERIVQFKNRMIINYEHVSLLINNMPDDEDRSGRLRDHLAMLVEGAEVRAQGIMTTLLSQQRGAVLDSTMDKLSSALMTIDASQRETHLRINMAVTDMTEMVNRALLSITLSEKQEDYLMGIIKKGVDNILNAQSAEVEVQNSLSTIIDSLKGQR